MELATEWIQQKAERANLFSSALFCLALSAASLLAGFDIAGPGAPALQAASQPQSETALPPSPEKS